MLIFNIIFPIFAIAILGYTLAATGFLNKEHITGISRYVFNIAIPLLLFNAISNMDLPATIEWSLFLSFYIPSILIFIVMNLVGRYVFGYQATGHAAFGLGCCYGNTVLIGIPLVAASFGDEGLLPLLLIISIHAAIFLSASIITAESGQGSAGKRLTGLDIVAIPIKKVVQNLLVVGLLTGLFFNYMDFALPEAIERTIEFIRGSALPCALLVMGASMSEYKLSGAVDKAMVIVVTKMVVHPLLVYLMAFHVFDLNPLWGAIVVIAASMPTGINAALLAREYQAAVAPVSTAVLLSTLMALGSIPVVLSLFL
ncbi:MAG: AEC family transporter [Chloroflexota bacterium]